MAISIKKIVSIGLGGLMLGSTVCSGAFAVEKVGDVDSFVSDIVSTDNSNVDIIVGSNSVASDVVSAANIAAKIGSLSFLEQNGKSAAATLSVSASASSDDFDLLNDDATDDSINFTSNGKGLFIACADGDCADALVDITYDDSTGLDADNGAKSLGKLSTLSSVDDIDPSDWFNSDDDAYEFLFAKLNNDSGEWNINEEGLAYAVISFKDDASSFDDITTLCPGKRIPFMGEEWVIIGMSADKDSFALGKEVYDGVIKEGESYDLSNGFEVKIVSILKNNDDEYKLDAQILKDGKVLAENTDVPAFNLCSSGIGVRINSAWENVGSDYGYAELVIVNNMKCLSLGEEYVPDWEAYGILKVGNTLEYTEDFKSKEYGQKKVGLALKYVGDDLEDIESGDEITIADYGTFTLDDEDEDDKLRVFFEMNEEKEVNIVKNQKVNVLNAEIVADTIFAGDEESLTVNAPVVKLDTETSMEYSENPLILVGGPVVNSITKELVNAGLFAIDDDSLATLAVVSETANGNDVLIVAGGDRSATTEAANALIAMI
ncbi:S-layer protein (TIGR01564 family) [Methanococcus maripaludis]|uniref:S-layer protein (TIGR01564 family) n=1 Tax=Methanococcus maripaludis TaxID=39152 RepID=A0A7J9P4N0_METMI|nr:S-layer protein [Methanococcus maripaludis]MBA2858161.1 S-layer protein (TIGR01564 family) [Methanococcus maripaludis]